PAPGGGAVRTLSRVEPENLATGTAGNTMNIWADCGRSGRDVMGAGRGTGKNFDEMTARYRKYETPGFFTKLFDMDWSGRPRLVEKETSAYSPDTMKAEILRDKLGGATLSDAFARYQALSPAPGSGSTVRRASTASPRLRWARASPPPVEATPSRAT
ncbi:hypothetical protein ACLESO_55685, partial [Pyxidicoccus sp. 3LG]